MCNENNTTAQRVSAVRGLFTGWNVDGLLFLNMNNIYYLSGFTGSDGALIIDESGSSLLVDGRYITQAKQEAAAEEIIEYKDKHQAIVGTVRARNLQRIGFESAFLSVQQYDQLLAEFTGEVLIPLGDELKLLRACKDKTEISLMKKAAEIGSASISSLLGHVQAGCSEKELAWQLENAARRLGADQLAFEAIVASGKNSALPHAKPTDRQIRRGDFIVVDFGVKYGGYCSDETCTFAFGELTDDQKHAYQKVKNAHDRAIEAIQAQVLAGDIDKLAREVLGEELTRYFSHSTGHGVGLEVHEAPRLSPDSKDILKAKMVVTVEPGVYLPGHWGIRIEDTVLVKENSCEKITKMDKELIII